MKPTKIAAVAIAGVAAADLLTGNTGNPILPDFLANHLTQQFDLILIAVAVFLWMH